MEENNYFLSWQLPPMSLSWLCVIPVGCSVVGLNKGRKKGGLRWHRLAKKAVGDEDLNEHFWEL